jgi:protease I
MPVHLNHSIQIRHAKSKTLLAFLDEVYEDLELWYPKLRLEEAGCALECAALGMKTYTGKHGCPA